MIAKERPTVAIIGAGFGGLYATKQLAKADVDVLLIDRHNYHLFTPLLYQVATSGLEPGEIAYPIRGILRGMSNARFLMGNVEQIDPDQKIIAVRTNHKSVEHHYDYLIIAAGSQTHYFGMESIERHAFGLKHLSEAVILRNHLLKCFEKAAWTSDPTEKAALTTMVVVGGGPTGLETAGALHELYRYVLRKEYANQLAPDMGQVILIEMQDHLLTSYPSRLQTAAHQQLEAMGVEIILGDRVVAATDRQIELGNGRIIPTRSLVWAAGVKASPIAELLGVPLQRGNRVPVRNTLEIESHSNIYAVGDIAYLEDSHGEPYPMLIPVAKQQGILAAKNITRRIQGLPQKPFTYSGLKDRGIMATIGRSRAVAWIFYRVQLTGFLAWLAWLVLHLITLMGFRNRLNVFVNWIWNYFTYDRSIRIILEHQSPDAFTRSDLETGNWTKSESESDEQPVLEQET